MTERFDAQGGHVEVGETRDGVRLIVYSDELDKGAAVGLDAEATVKLVDELRGIVRRQRLWAKKEEL